VEYVNSVWQIGIIALVAGVLIGALAYRLLSPSVKQADKVKTELDVAREELDSYRASVNQHFDKTSELVNDLTQNYVKVYQHLAQGAQTLGGSKTLNNLLEQHQGKVSIAVDAETSATVVEPAVTPAASAETMEEPAEPIVVPAKSAATVDEHAEPFVDRNIGAGDPAEPAHDAAETSASSSVGDAGDESEAGKPVLNVEALEEASEGDDKETGAQSNSAVPGSGEKTAARPTTH